MNYSGGNRLFRREMIPDEGGQSRGTDAEFVTETATSINEEGCWMRVVCLRKPRLVYVTSGHFIRRTDASKASWLLDFIFNFGISCIGLLNGSYLAKKNQRNDSVVKMLLPYNYLKNLFKKKLTTCSNQGRGPLKSCIKWPEHLQFLRSNITRFIQSKCLKRFLHLPKRDQISSRLPGFQVPMQQRVLNLIPGWSR